MLSELLEQDCGEQVRSGKAARRDVEGCRGLRDRLAIAAAEALAHGLDHLPAARDHLQRLGHILAELRQPCRTAARAGLRRGDDDALSRQVIRKRATRRPPALERSDRLRGRLLRGPFVLARRRLELLQLKLHLVEEPRLALRAGAVELAPQLLDGQLQMRDEGFAARQIRLRVGRLGPCIGELGLRRDAGRALGTISIRSSPDLAQPNPVFGVTAVGGSGTITAGTKPGTGAASDRSARSVRRQARS